MKSNETYRIAMELMRDRPPVIDPLTQALAETAAIQEQAPEPGKPLVFVAGPYSAKTRTGELMHVEQAVAAGHALRMYGCIPLVPHLLDTFDQIAKTKWLITYEYEDWLEITLRYVRACDAVYVVDESPGVLREVAEAGRFGIPVFNLLRTLTDYFKKRGRL